MRAQSAALYETQGRSPWSLFPGYLVSLSWLCKSWPQVWPLIYARSRANIHYRATLVSLSCAILSFYQVRNGTAYWNPAYTGFNFTVLTLAELSAAILCACTPVIRPFFTKAGQVVSQSMSPVSLRAMLSKRRTSSRSASGDSNGSISLEKETEKDKNTITRTIAVDLYSNPQQQADFRATDDFGGVKCGARPAAAMGWT